MPTLLRNTIYVLLLLITCFCSCQTKQSKKSDERYKQLFEQATDKYKYGDLDGSHLIFLELLSIVDDVSSNKENQRIELVALNYLGDIMAKTGAVDLAYEEFEKAQVLAEKYNNEAYQIQAILNMAFLEKYPENLEIILENANKNFSNNKKNIYSLGQIEYALGLLYAKNKQANKALQIFGELLHNETYKDQDKVEVYKGIGIAYSYKQDFKLAIEHFDSALQLVEDKTIMQLQVLIEKAQVFSLTKQYEKFKFLLDKVKPTLDTLKDLSIKKQINILQINVCDHTKDFQGKAEKLNELKAINEQLDEEAKALLVSIVSNFKNSEIKNEKKTQETKRKYLKILLGLASLLFVSIISSLVLFYKHIQLALKSFNKYIDGKNVERKRLADQLHDILAAHLAATRIEFMLLKKELPLDKYERLLKMLTDNLNEVRNVAYNIMPPVLVNSGLISAVKEKINFWSNEKLQLVLTSNIEEIKIYDDLKFALYQCIMESLSNVIKNAHASKATIAFTLLENDTLQITIKDNGIGFDTNKIEKGEGGLGISGMSSRIKYFKGKFQIYSKSGEGTLVKIIVPVKRDIKK